MPRIFLIFKFHFSINIPKRGIGDVIRQHIYDMRHHIFISNIIKYDEKSSNEEEDSYCNSFILRTTSSLEKFII